MFNLFKSSAILKGYKVTNVDRSKKYGIAANSLKMLKDKASKKFSIKKCKIYLAKDGVEIDDEDYFQLIPAQTLFIIAEKSEIVKTDFELLYETIQSMNSDVLQAGELITQFLSDNKKEITDVLIEAQKQYKDMIDLSLKSDHKEWFQGQDLKLSTKEEVMARRSQDRIRGYFYKTKDELTKNKLFRSNKLARNIFNNFIEILKQLLIGVDHFSCLFDRQYKNKHKLIRCNDEDEIDLGPSPRKKIKENVKNILKNNDIFEDVSVSLCSNSGDFKCQGIWNQNNCNYPNHLINPYASRENLILFQIWNLDHQIEITRSVIPSIIESVESLAGKTAFCPKHKRPGQNLTVIKYFLELFTIDNLKLVHIVCHDKSTHQNLKSKGGIICEKCEEFVFLQKFHLNENNDDKF